jgi:hypothetical protein
VHECRVHPQHQLWVGGRIRCARRESAELGCGRAADARVDRPDNGAGLLSLGLSAEGDHVEGAQRPDKPAPEVAVVARVRDDAAPDKRMRDLE